MLNQFADELKKLREENGLTLQQLANKTRIDLKFLEAIELGNFAFLPELYVKAFVKQYAKTVGMDETIAIKKYEAAKEGKEFDPAPPIPVVEEIKPKHSEVSDAQKPELKTEQKTETPKAEEHKPVVKSAAPLKSYVDEPKRTEEDERKANRQLMIFGLGGVGLILVAALVYFLFFTNNNKIIVQETPIDEVIEQTNQRYEEEKVVEPIVNDTMATETSSDSLYLTFTASEASWIFVVLDNNRTQEFTLSPDSKFTVSAVREFKATVGNSGSVALQMNNNKVDFSGRPGSVRYFKLDKTGLIYLNTPPKIEQQ